MTETASAPQAERSFRALMATSVIAPLLLFMVAAGYDYAHEKADAKRQLIATADALAEHAQKVIETSQLVQTLVIDRVRGADWDRMSTDVDLHAFLVRMSASLPQVESIFLVGPNWHVVASSRAFPMTPFDAHEREYALAAMSGTPGMVVSAPFVGSTNGTSAFTVSRPIDPTHPQAGVVVVTLSPDYFRRFYATVSETHAEARAALIRRDGVFLVRYPEGGQVTQLNDMTGLTAQRIGAEASGVVEGATPPDASKRLIAFRQLTGAPLVATYSISVRGALADWVRHVAVLALFAVGLGGMLAYAARIAMSRAREERRGLRLLVAETRRREQAEDALRQLQKMEALGRLTGGVAHDFNNLLTAVMGSVELATKRVTDPRVLRLLTGAMEAAQRGARLTHQMLAFSRQQDLRLEPVSVNAALAAMDEMLARALGPEVSMQSALSDGLWPAMADPTQLEVAVLNLAINARDAMPGGGTLRIATANIAAEAKRPPGAPSGDLVEVSVQDTGTGMSEAVASRAMEPFFTTKEVGRGTGLGLSMVHGFARRAHGALSIESTLGQGTTVRLFLPRAAENPAEVGKDAVAAESVSPRQPSRLVLIVDDDDDVRALAVEMLRELGHRVVEACDGPSALRLLEATPQVELMVVDYAMPRMNGGEVARRVTQIRPGLPLMFVSGYAERTALEEWTARGYGLVAKPFTMPQLAAAVASATAERSLAAAR